MLSNIPIQQAPAANRGLYAWMRLVLLTILLLLIMMVLGPLGLRLPGFRQMDRMVTESNLKATAIYYTDLEEFARAESTIRDGLRFAPEGASNGIQPRDP